MTRNAARLRFAAYAICVLAIPAALMATGRPQLVDLGRLAMILLPGPVGLLLRPGRARAPPRWRWIARAPVVTVLVAAASLGAAAAAGLLRHSGGAPEAGAIASAAGLSALTSLLEEWGWAGAGLPLAVGALGRRRGVVALGLVWAAWHLAPVMLKVGMFPDLEAGPALRLAAFVAACVAYRELLTHLQHRAKTWLAAAAAHAAPNAMMAGVMAAGFGGFQDLPTGPSILRRAASSSSPWPPSPRRRWPGHRPGGRPDPRLAAANGRRDDAAAPPVAPQ